MMWSHAGELRKWLMNAHSSKEKLSSVTTSLRHIKVSSFGRATEWSYLRVKTLPLWAVGELREECQPSLNFLACFVSLGLVSLSLSLSVFLSLFLSLSLRFNFLLLKPLYNMLTEWYMGHRSCWAILTVQSCSAECYLASFWLFRISLYLTVPVPCSFW